MDKQAIPQITPAGFSALIVFIPILAAEISLTIQFNRSTGLIGSEELSESFEAIYSIYWR